MVAVPAAFEFRFCDHWGRKNIEYQVQATEVLGENRSGANIGDDSPESITMFQMKSVVWFTVAVLCTSAILGAQQTPVSHVVNADGPTIVAFFPNASKAGSDNADANEALSDFQFYAERVKEPLNQLGIQFTEQFGGSFRIRSGGETRLFTPKAETPGYYFTEHRKRPHIEYGVMTDVDLLALAKEYFGASHSPDTSIATEPATSLPGVFGSVVAEVKTKSRITVLLPSELSQPVAGAKYAVVEKASEGEYAISLYYEMGIGNAGFAALFAAQADPSYELQELPNVRKIELSKGFIGYFRPVSCGGSCAPSNLWWKEDRVLYQIQLKLPYTVPENDQRKALVAAANSAILAGPR